MTKRKIDLLFMFFVFVSIIIFVFGYYAINNAQAYDLPKTNGEFNEWEITSCESKDGFIYASGWAAPKGAYKLKTELYVLSEGDGKYYKVKTLLYPRGHQTDEMKANRYFDNSGFVSALRLPMHSGTLGNKVAILSLGRDGEWYRGEYECSK